MVRDAFSEALGAKTGFYGTEGEFGAKNGLLVYRTHLRRCETASYCTGRIFRGAPCQKQASPVRNPH